MAKEQLTVADVWCLRVEHVVPKRRFAEQCGDTCELRQRKPESAQFHGKVGRPQTVLFHLTAQRVQPGREFVKRPREKFLLVRQHALVEKGTNRDEQFAHFPAFLARSVSDSHSASVSTSIQEN